MARPVHKSEYLKKEFDYKKELTKEQLRSILFAHDVPLPPTNAPKSVLLEAYKINIFDKIDELSKPVEPDGKGIQIMKNFSTENVFQSPRKSVKESKIKESVDELKSLEEKEYFDQKKEIYKNKKESVDELKSLEEKEYFDQKKEIYKNKKESVDELKSLEEKEYFDQKKEIYKNKIADQKKIEKKIKKDDFQEKFKTDKIVDESVIADSFLNDSKKFSPVKSSEKEQKTASKIFESIKRKTLDLQEKNKSNLFEETFLVDEEDEKKGPKIIVEREHFRLVDTPRRLKKVVVSKKEIPNVRKEAFFLFALVLYTYFKHVVCINFVKLLNLDVLLGNSLINKLELVNVFEMPFLILMIGILIIFLNKKNNLIKQIIKSEVERISDDLILLVKNMEEDGKCVGINEIKELLGVEKRVWNGVVKRMENVVGVRDGIVNGKRVKVWECL